MKKLTVTAFRTTPNHPNNEQQDFQVKSPLDSLQGRYRVALPHIKVISFDLDDTLWPIEPVIRRADEKTWAYIKSNYGAIARAFTPTSARALRESVSIEMEHLRHDLGALRVESNRRLVRNSGYAEDRVEPIAQELFEHYWQWRNAVTYFMDAQPSLSALANRYTLIGVTNGNAGFQETGLDQWLRGVIYARDVGVVKPAAAVYDHALAFADCQPHQMLHVGDNMVDDIEGAQARGIHTCWLNRTGDQANDVATITCSSLAELVDILD